MACLVVGLGNPGLRYRRTRHNLGFMVVDSLHRRLHGGRWQRQKGVLLSRVKLEEQEVLLGKPQNFMNNSGPPVAALLRVWGLSPEELIVVHDDLDLPTGRIRVRFSGSAGGHRGMASILTSLGTQQVGRVKVGIGRPPWEIDPMDYVLDVPGRDEWEAVRDAIDKAVLALEFILAGNSREEAMNRFN